MPHRLLASGESISFGDDRTTGQVQDNLGTSPGMKTSNDTKI